MKKGMVFVVLAMVICFTFINNSLAVDWRNSWDSEKSKSLIHCKKIFPDSFAVQELCMQGEEEGFRKLQGNYGLSSDIANKAKNNCSRIFPDSFSVQDLCVQGEADGYNKLKKY